MQSSKPSPSSPIYSPFYRSEIYPRSVKVNFTKLKYMTLEKYANMHKIPIRPNCTHYELAVAVALHFESLKVEPIEVMETFFKNHHAGLHAAELAAQKPGPTQLPISRPLTREEAFIRPSSEFQEFSLNQKHSSSSYKAQKPVQVRGSKRLEAKQKCEINLRERSKRRSSVQFDEEIPDSSSNARSGEEVACLMYLNPNETESSWILARIEKYSVDTDQYLCTDEDDKMNSFYVAAGNVIRLEDSTKNLQKGENILAVFPDTTSFYKGMVHRVHRGSSRSQEGGAIEVKFVDDEDEQGLTPSRKIKANHVIRVPQPKQKESQKRLRTPGPTPLSVYGDKDAQEDNGVSNRRTKRVRASR